jgi:hypothetical protein
MDMAPVDLSNLVNIPNEGMYSPELLAQFSLRFANILAFESRY